MTEIQRQQPVEILLAAFNAEEYLPRQIESILNQTYANFNLLILDDHSSDGTQGLIKGYQAADSRIVVVLPPQPFRQPLRSFEYLLGLSTAEIVFLSDHDDVWLPEKLSQQLETIAPLTHSTGPLLVASNTYVAAAGIDTRTEFRDYPCFRKASFVSWFNALNGQHKSSYLCHSNLVIGHTIALNRALVELSLPFPDTVRMHDWWLAILASLSGVIYVDERPMTLYRQHRDNSIGSSSRLRLLASFEFRGILSLLPAMMTSLVQFAAAVDRVSRSYVVRPFDHSLKTFILTIPFCSRWQLLSGFLKFGLFAPIRDSPKLLGQVLMIFLHQPRRPNQHI